MAWRKLHPWRASGLVGVVLMTFGLLLPFGGLVSWPEPVEQTVEQATTIAASSAVDQRAVAAENASKRTVVLALVGGLIASGGLWVSISGHRRQSKHDAHVHEKDRQDLVHQRYATAIEHLGLPNPAIQAAATYGLEDVIKGDPDRRVAIVQTLVALMADVRAELLEHAGPDSEASPDVRMIAGQVVIARQREALGAPPAWLPGADLGSFDLRDARLIQADLSNAYVVQADLSASSLIDANLSAAILVFADLVETNLSEANLVEADIRDADLTLADLSDANLTLADLSESVLVAADLRRANLSGANLEDADLSTADLELVGYDDSTNWQGTNVWGVKGMPDDWCPPGAVREPPEGEAT